MQVNEKNTKEIFVSAELIRFIQRYPLLFMRLQYCCAVISAERILGDCYSCVNRSRCDGLALRNAGVWRLPTSDKEATASVGAWDSLHKERELW